MNFDANIEKIEGIIGYTFADKSLLCQAFTRASFCNEAGRGESYQSNEVLEFFGDSALSLAIVTRLITSKTERYRHGIKTELAEGDFSNIRSKLADKKSLSDNVARLGLERFLIMGEGDRKQDIQNERSVREDLFESIIGAIYIDSHFNMDAVIASVENMLDISVYLGKTKTVIQSPKNVLQEWCADKSRRMPPPVYEVTAESGPDHDKRYTVACFVGGKRCGTGTARKIKDAEAAAAADAIGKLGI